MEGQREILGHDTILVNNLDTGILDVETEITQSGVVIELSPVDQTSGPSKDGRDGVC